MPLPYPPPFQDLATLSEHICAAESTIENWVKMGIFPKPVKHGGKNFWEWEKVQRHLADRADAVAESTPQAIGSLMNKDRLISITELCQTLSINELKAFGLIEEGALPRSSIVNGGRFWKLSEVTESDFVKRPEEWNPKKIDPGFGPRCVYFIQIGEFIKIGWTGSIAKRRGQIQSSIPYDVTLLHTILGDYELEEILHAQFQHLHHRGEWFRADTELIDYINSLKAGGEILPWFK